MGRAILSGLSGLALLSSCFVLGCGSGSLGDMLTTSVAHRNDITNPLLVSDVKERADKLVAEYTKGDKKDYSKLKDASNLYIAIGIMDKARECAKLVLESDAISGLNLYKEIQREMPSDNK